MTMSRYALYFVPEPKSPLAEFGARWLGRDVWSGKTVSQISIGSLSASELREITANPAVYGFHGTLKPPFQLAEGMDPGHVVEHLTDFVRSRPPFRIPNLMLRRLSGFLALVPSAASAELNQFAAESVRDFDRFRAPPSAGELEKRRHQGLSPRQEEYLLAWGYPYVLEEFRFHLTLTGRLEDEVWQRLTEALLPIVEPLCSDDVLVDAVTLCEQPGTGEPFKAIGRFELAG